MSKKVHWGKGLPALTETPAHVHLGPAFRSTILSLEPETAVSS